MNVKLYYFPLDSSTRFGQILKKSWKGKGRLTRKNVREYVASSLQSDVQQYVSKHGGSDVLSIDITTGHTKGVPNI